MGRITSVALGLMLTATAVHAETAKVNIYSRFPLTSTIGISGMKFTSMLNTAQTKYEFVYTVLAGAGGEIADQRALVAARAKERVLVWGTTSNFSLNGLQFPNSYDRDNDFVFVSSILTTSSNIVVPKSSKINSIEELVALLKSKDKVFTASTLQSNLHKINNQAFLDKFGIKNVETINYNTATEISKSMLTGETDYTVQNQDDVTDSKALVTSLKNRHYKFPDVPNGVDVNIPDFQFSSLGLLYTPKENQALANEIKDIVFKVCLTDFNDFLNSLPTWYTTACDTDDIRIKTQILKERSLVSKYSEALTFK